MQSLSESLELQHHVADLKTQRGFPKNILAILPGRHWRVLFFALLLLLLYGGVIAGLMADWYKNGDDAHGFFVLPLSAYFAWRKRDILVSLGCKPALAGLLWILGSMVLLFVGSLGAELFLTRISVVATIAGLIVYFWGWQILRALAFPLCFSLLMIPLPAIIYYQIVFPLQLLASRLATFGLEWLNLFPVIREGNLLFLPHYTLEVVEACSGVRSLIALFALALGYGYLAQPSKVMRGVLVLLVVPLAILSNASRVTLQALIVYYRGLDISERPWHQTTGLMTFISAALLLLLVNRVFCQSHCSTKRQDNLLR
jgi:exosortase